jgi:hypothetical protein
MVKTSARKGGKKFEIRNSKFEEGQARGIPPAPTPESLISTMEPGEPEGAVHVCFVFGGPFRILRAGSSSGSGSRGACAAGRGA